MRPSDAANTDVAAVADGALQVGPASTVTAVPASVPSGHQPSDRVADDVAAVVVGGRPGAVRERQREREAGAGVGVRAPRVRGGDHGGARVRRSDARNAVEVNLEREAPRREHLGDAAGGLRPDVAPRGAGRGDQRQQRDRNRARARRAPPPPLRPQAGADHGERADRRDETSTG